MKTPIPEIRLLELLFLCADGEGQPKKISRGVIGSIFIDEKNSRLVATDGHILAYYEGDLKEILTLPSDFLLVHSIIKREKFFSKFPAKNSDLDMEYPDYVKILDPRMKQFTEINYPYFIDPEIGHKVLWILEDKILSPGKIDKTPDYFRDFKTSGDGYLAGMIARHRSYFKGHIFIGVMPYRRDPSTEFIEPSFFEHPEKEEKKKKQCIIK